MKFNLNDLLKDIITGYTGVVVSKTEWLNGCKRYGLQSKKLKDGIPVEVQHFDEAQLTLVKAACSKVERHTAPASGGPKPDDRGMK